jgi:hypothetical protein
MAHGTGTDPGIRPIGAGLAVAGHFLSLVRQWAGMTDAEASPPCAAAITYVSTERRDSAR